MEASIKATAPNKGFENEKYNHTLPKTTTKDYKIVCTHLIDGIYQGFVNASYQRDGFGILLTHDFQTYIGYFKYNKPNGMGLMIYSDGSIIYGTFHNGSLQGIGLTDNGLQIQVGIFKNTSLMGIGYSYACNTEIWKMNSYHKGVPIEVIKQQTMPIDEGFPNFMSIEAQIITLLLNYSKKTFFHKLHFKQQVQEFNSFYIHPLSQGQYYFGYLLNKRFEGLGIRFDFIKKQVCQAGMYKDGKLNGYGMKIDSIAKLQEFGFYIEGKKDGLFLLKQGNKIKFSQFSKNVLIFDDKKGEKLQSIKKQQKVHNYRQKDFLSTRNNLDIQSFRVVFQSNEYKAWKVQQQKDKKQKGDKPIQNKHKNKLPKDPLETGTQSHEKSSIQIMKEKIFNLMVQKDGKKSKNERTSALLFNKEVEGIEKANYEMKKQDDDIALEQNPINNLEGGFFSKKRSMSFQNYHHKSIRQKQ